MSNPLDRTLNQQRRRSAMANAASSRSAYGYWIPLALTVTAATAGIAAWALRGRGEGVDAAEEERQRRRRDPRNRRPSVQKRDSSYSDAGGSRESGTVDAGSSAAQRLYDQARGGVAAGAAAVEEIVDQRTKSPDSEQDEDSADKAKDEAKRAKRKALQTERSYQRQTQAKRKLVAVVVSAESQARLTQNGEDDEDSVSPIQSSILAHLDPHIDEDTTQLVILLYAPHLRVQPTSSLPRSGASSRQTPDDEESDNGPDAAYEAISQQAQSLVSDSTHVLPFTTPSGHIHILRHMTPSVVYIQESLCGASGELVDMINGWVGQILVVVGADGLGGGLVDSETEDEAGGGDVQQQDKWWQNEKKVGSGKGVEVVETLRIGDDWKRRVER